MKKSQRSSESKVVFSHVYKCCMVAKPSVEEEVQRELDNGAS